jgi:hypothetical protein
MPQPNGDHVREVSDESRKEEKRPYQKPSFRCEKIFETMALQCGKVQTTQSGCHSNRKAS